ncbi:MAG: universal stress protein [Bifidobacterium pseudocatenulatum]
MSEAATKPDIVVGVDGSDESFAALKWALEEASLTGQSVNAVFGWTHSWDMGSEPDSDEAWAKVRHDIAQRAARRGSTRPLQGIDHRSGESCQAHLGEGLRYFGTCWRSAMIRSRS